MNFSEALAAIFDAGPLSRKQWSEILGVKEEILLSWIQNKSMPTPTCLRAILDIAERDDRFESALYKLNAILDEPINWERKTLRHYLIAPILNQFLESLDTLSPANQERVLFEASRLIRKQREK